MANSFFGNKKKDYMKERLRKKWDWLDWRNLGISSIWIQIQTEIKFSDPNFHMHIFSLTPPHLLTPATMSPSFKSFSTTSARPQLGPVPFCLLSPVMEQAIEATSTPPPPFTNLSLCLFTARLHNSLAQQSSKHSVCPITTAAPPPFYWCVRRDSEWVSM